MGILEQTSNCQNCIKKTNKIPEYARDCRNEYLFVRGINKTCEKIIKTIISEEEEIFKISKIKKLMLFLRKFLKAQELGNLKDTSMFCFKQKDVKNIKKMFELINDIIEYYEVEDDDFNFYLNYLDFYELFLKFYFKIYYKEKYLNF